MLSLIDLLEIKALLKAWNQGKSKSIDQNLQNNLINSWDKTNGLIPIGLWGVGYFRNKSNDDMIDFLQILPHVKNYPMQLKRFF